MISQVLVLVVLVGHTGGSRQPSQASRPADPTIDHLDHPTLVANFIITMIKDGNEEAEIKHRYIQVNLSLPNSSPR